MNRKWEIGNKKWAKSLYFPFPIPSLCILNSKL